MRFSHKTETGVRHVGPLAQDFYAAFGVGPDDRRVTAIDEDGVALAAIQAVNRNDRALRARLVRVDSELAELKSEVAALRSRNLGTSSNQK